MSQLSGIFITLTVFLLVIGNIFDMKRMRELEDRVDELEEKMK